MQIDFHHAATYAIARLAGFGHAQAATIAYASQYVDDSVNQGTLRFDNGNEYARIASAHTVFDLANNTQNHEDYQVWVPFHFLPGNNGAKASEAGSVPLAQRLVCTPDSPLANDLWLHCRERRNEANALHRLGITAHVYSDTFSHQMFTGLKHKVNHVGNLTELSHLFDQVLDKLEGAMANLLEIGHGGALTCPDLPYLTWQYTDWCGAEQRRENPKDFRRASIRLFEQFSYYLGHEAEPRIGAADQAQIDKLIDKEASKEESERHQAWLTTIRTGIFSFGMLSDAEYADLRYAAFGPGSWRHAALGIVDQHDPQGLVVHYDHRFESSDWKHFHDALKEHQEFVLETLLPAYGLPGSFEAARAMGV